MTIKARILSYFPARAVGTDGVSVTKSNGVYTIGLSGEEGTYTPVLTFSGASVGLTYVEQTGTYTRLGRVVHFAAKIAINSNGTSSGTARVSIPVTSANDSIPTAVSVSVHGLTSSTVDFQAYVLPNTSTIELVSVANGNATALSESVVTDGSTILVAGTYQSA